MDGLMNIILEALFTGGKCPYVTMVITYDNNSVIG